MAWKRFRKKRELPSGLWVKCPTCGAMLFKKELIRNLHVCGECDNAFAVSAAERAKMLADKDSFVEHGLGIFPLDRLDFVDNKEPYSEKLRRSMEKSGAQEAAIYGTCTVEGKPIVLAVLDFTFIGGSMGCVVGEKVTRAVELATQKRWPVLIVSASGGARMHEGALSLMQMSKTAIAIERHHEKGCLYISLLTNPTTGGVMASFAALGDIILAEPQALIGFAGPRVIRETLRQQLPDGFQRSEFLLEHGFLDRIVAREDQRSTLASIIGMLWTYADGEVVPEGSWEPPLLAPDDDIPEEGADGTPVEAKAEDSKEA